MDSKATRWLLKKTRLVRTTRALRHRYLDDFAFIHINKTGGSSIEKALHIPREHKTALEKIDELGRSEWDRRFTFTVIRNPWDKVVSHYSYRVDTDQTDLAVRAIGFKEWVMLSYRDKNPLYYDTPMMFMPQSDWITDSNGQDLIKFTCRFENLSDDFSEVCKIIGKSIELPHIKTSRHKNYREYYDEETYEIIERQFRKDITKYGYRFDI